MEQELINAIFFHDEKLMRNYCKKYKDYINNIDSYGLTPLYYVCNGLAGIPILETIKLMKILFEYGADPNILINIKVKDNKREDLDYSYKEDNENYTLFEYFIFITSLTLSMNKNFHKVILENEGIITPFIKMNIKKCFSYDTEIINLYYEATNYEFKRTCVIIEDINLFF